MNRREYDGKTKILHTLDCSMYVCIYDATANNDSTRFYTNGDQQTKIVQSNRYG
jgi:hypothetical protein